MTALKTAGAGSTVIPDRLHSRTETVFAVPTYIVPNTPPGSVPGHPGATLLPGAAPVSVKLMSAAHAPFAIAGKSSVALPLRYVGTSAESTATVLAAPASTTMIPCPGFTTFVESQARQSVP